VSRRLYVKPSTCTEGYGVYLTDISVKVSEQYPGRSGDLRIATNVERRREESAEVSSGHSVR
jgi:hypothetical protein